MSISYFAVNIRAFFTFAVQMLQFKQISMLFKFKYLTNKKSQLKIKLTILFILNLLYYLLSAFLITAAA